MAAGAKEGAGDLKEQAKATAQLAGLRMGTMQDWGMPAVQLLSGIADAVRNPKATLKAMKPDMSDPARGSARFAVSTLLPLMLPLAKPGFRALKSAAAKPPVVPPGVPGGHLVKAPVKTSITDALAGAADDLRVPEAPKTVTLPSQNAQPRVSYPRAAEPKAAPQKQAPAKKAAPVAPKAEAPAQQLPASWQKLVDAEKPKPTSRGTVTVPRLVDEPSIFSQAKPTVAETRRAVGARRTVSEYPEIEAIAKEIGVDPEVMIRDLSGGVKRRPNIVDAADDSLNYQRRIMDERGAVDPKLAVKIGLPVGGAALGAATADENPLAGGILGALAGLGTANPAQAGKAIQSLRVTGMLSGTALPKSIAGNTGAMLTAAAERGSMAPIKEALRLPTNARNAVQAFRSGANPSHTSGMGKINLPGRLIGALDEASTQALQRAGLSLDEAQRLLLTRPNPLGHGRFQKQLESPLGRFIMPFQRTPFNFGIEGMTSLNDLLPGSTAPLRNKALTVGAIGGGAAAGTQTDNPLALAILAAFAGPRGLPLALGAGTTAGPQVLKRMGVGFPEGSWQDLYDPTRPIDRPALLRMLEQLSGER
ncbi:MAG: hypothetical protein V4792_08005 [Pseudomonadota bacterium]